jgi:hypothetical protein
MPGGIFTVERAESTAIARLLDGFESFPVDSSAGLNTLPTGWWAKFPSDDPDTRASD